MTKDIAGHFYFLATGHSESLEFQASCCLVSGGFTQLCESLSGRIGINYLRAKLTQTAACKHGMSQELRSSQGTELSVPREAVWTNIHFRLSHEVKASSNKIFTGNSWPEKGFSCLCVQRNQVHGPQEPLKTRSPPGLCISIDIRINQFIGK